MSEQNVNLTTTTEMEEVTMTENNTNLTTTTTEAVSMVEFTIEVINADTMEVTVIPATVEAVMALRIKDIKATISALKAQGIIVPTKGEGNKAASKKELAVRLVAAVQEEQETNEVIVTFADGTDAKGEVMVTTGLVDGKVVHIDSAKLATEIINNMIPYQALKVQGIVIGKNSTYMKEATISQAYEDVDPSLVGVGEITLGLGKGEGSKSVENFMPGFFSVEFKSSHARRLAKRISKRGAYVVYNANGTIDIVVARYNGFTLEGFESVSDRGMLIDAYGNIITEALPEWKLVKIYGGSPAAARKGVFILVWAEFLPALKELHNVWYNDAADMNLEGFEGDAKKAAAASTRTQQHQTNHIVLGQLDTVAVYNGKYANGTMDGMAFLAMTKFKEMAKETLEAFLGCEVDITTEAIKGLGLQGRPGTGKQQDVLVTNGMMNLMVQHLVDNGAKLVIQQREGLTAERSKELQEMNDAVVIFTNNPEFVFGTDRVDLLTDNNAKKLDYNFGKPVDYRLLKVVKQSNRANLVGQLYTKIAAIPGAIEWIREVGKEYIADKLKGFDEKAKEGRLVSEKDLASSDIVRVANDLFREDVIARIPHLKKQTIISLWKEMAKALSALRFEVEGDYLTAQVDISAFFISGGVLAADEAFIPGVDTNSIEEALFLKFPSVHMREYLLAKLQSVDTVIDRVLAKEAAGKLTEAQSRAIITHYKMLSKAIAVVSDDDTLKNLLAGFDLDTDALMAFYNKDLVKMIKTHSSPLAVIIEPLESIDKNMYDLGIEGQAETAARSLQHEGLSIGVVTYLGELIASLLFMDDKGRRMHLKELFMSNGMFNEYNGLRRGTEGMFESVHVNEKDAMSVIEQLKSVNFMSPSVDVDVIIEDLVAITRYLQETTIDAPKTGLLSAVELALKIKSRKTGEVKDAASRWHMKLDQELNQDDQLVYSFRTNNRNFYIKSDLHNLRKELLEEAMTPLQARIDAVPTAIPDELVEIVDGKLPAHLVRLSKHWRAAYRAIQGAYVEAISPEYDEETGDFYDKTEAEIQFARMERTKKRLALTQAIRLATSDLSAVDRGRMMMYLSITNNEGAVVDGLGIAFYSIMPLEFFALLEFIAQGLRTPEEVAAGKFPSAGAVGQEVTVNNKFNTLEDGTTVLPMCGKKVARVSFDEYGNTEAPIIPQLGLEGDYFFTVRNGKTIVTKTIRQVVGELEEKMYEKKGPVTVFLEWAEDRKAAYEKLRGQRKAIITSNTVAGDYIRLVDGTPVANIAFPQGDSAISKTLDGRLFDIVSVEYRDSQGFKSVIVVLENGIYTEGGFRKPAGRYISEDPSFAKKRKEVKSASKVDERAVEESYESEFDIIDDEI